jgi:hypothetical protein
MPHPIPPGSGDDHRRFVASLTDEEAMLLTLRDELYGGDWDRMLRDLNDRRDGKPYVFKLVNLINEDIARIGKLRDYERANGINLTDYRTA